MAWAPVLRRPGSAGGTETAWPPMGHPGDLAGAPVGTERRAPEDSAPSAAQHLGLVLPLRPFDPIVPKLAHNFERNREPAAARAGLETA